ncbi:OLC1v1024020C1 [Oldenlandia corymbosa var. corymbosa]|uniref:OLC1v1024020C1 n=1 Tax=Oldenlandia corymbosa var. corymbosa TaxID=529605 RepID=A0AAV1C2S1_OLDCO|nr:OLC1v1024020C1 [Oldenlandia corymbosa var. corymbosa]
MEMIQHNYVTVRGLKHHVAEIGTGPAVVFLHGFPEIWYSWRNQMVAVANAGFRAIAPDFRGYGLTEIPAEPEKTTFKDLVDDLLDLFDSYQLPKVFLVGKDFGARVVYHFTLLHQDRVSGVVTMGLPFLPIGPDATLDSRPKGFYVMRWREPARAEADFGRFDIKTVVKKIYILFTESELQVAKEDQEVLDLVDESAPLPPWFSEEDLDNYAKLYENSGFRTALQIPYRGWLEYDGVENPRVDVPSLLIMGEKDYAMHLPGVGDFIKSGMVKKYVPDLEITFVPEGNHFIQEQLPDKVLVHYAGYYHLFAQASAIRAVGNRVCSGIVAMSFLSVSRAITVAGTFSIFGAISAISVLFVYAIVPETKGKSLEQIGQMFEDGYYLQSGEVQL